MARRKTTVDKISVDLEAKAPGDESEEIHNVLCVQVKANRKPTKVQVEAMSNIHVTSEVWIHRDRADVWDVYEPTDEGVSLLRKEPYNRPLSARR